MEFSGKNCIYFHFFVDEYFYCVIIIDVRFGGKPKQLYST